jgi:hypothetical protein
MRSALLQHCSRHEASNNNCNNPTLRPDTKNHRWQAGEGPGRATSASAVHPTRGLRRHPCAAQHAAERRQPLAHNIVGGRSPDAARKTPRVQVRRGPTGLGATSDSLNRLGPPRLPDSLSACRYALSGPLPPGPRPTQGLRAPRRRMAKAPASSPCKRCATPCPFLRRWHVLVLKLQRRHLPPVGLLHDPDHPSLGRRDESSPSRRTRQSSKPGQWTPDGFNEHPHASTPHPPWHSLHDSTDWEGTLTTTTCPRPGRKTDSQSPIPKADVL